MTAPHAMIASNVFNSATFLTASGISYAPGTATTVTSFSSTPCLIKPSFAPSTSCLTIISLKRLITIATFKPLPM